MITRILTKATRLFNKPNHYARVSLIILMLFVFHNIFGQRYLTISKGDFKLSVIENEDTLFQCPIAVGKAYGDKTMRGDMKTPEGTFKIVSIEKSSKWKHDFKDGKGIRNGAYGPWFFRLNVPNFRGIGIHGTCKPETIETRDSEGCIRLLNDDLVALKSFIRIGMMCIIEADKTND